jgi:hypothetical protein
MIGFFEGALSSRRKRAEGIIIRPAGKSSSNYFSSLAENAGCFLTADKGENDVFHGVEVFSSRPKKTWGHYSPPAEIIKRRRDFPFARRIS